MRCGQLKTPAPRPVVGQFGSYPPVIPARLLCLARERSRNPGPFARQPRARVTQQKLKLTHYPPAGRLLLDSGAGCFVRSG